MTLFRSLIRAVSSMEFFTHAGATGVIPPAVRLLNAVSVTNNYIAETHGKTGMFATIFFGILDTETGVMSYVNGGHLPPMIINSRGEEKVLPRTGPAVGALPDVVFGIRTVQIEPGDTFFAYTDGLTDTVNAAGDYFSIDMVRPLLGTCALPALMAQIQQLVEEFAMGAHRLDDITLLAIRRT